MVNIVDMKGFTITTTRTSSSTSPLIAENFIDLATHFNLWERVAHMKLIINTPNLGGAAPCAAPTLRKRGPPALRTGSGGRLPTRTLPYSQLAYKNLHITPGTWRAGPTARRGDAMVRVGSVMAMALMGVTLTLVPVAEWSNGATVALDAQGANHSGTGTEGHSETWEVIGLGFAIVLFTPGLTLSMGIGKRTFGVLISRPTRAALGVGRSLSAASARETAAKNDGKTRNDDLTCDGTTIYAGIPVIIIIIIFGMLHHRETYGTRTLGMMFLMTNVNGDKGNTSAATTINRRTSGTWGTSKRSAPTQWIAQAANLNDNCDVMTYFIGGARDTQAPVTSVGSYIDMVSNRAMSTRTIRDDLYTKMGHPPTPPA